MIHHSFKTGSRYGAALALALALLLPWAGSAQAQADSPYVGQIIFTGFNFAPVGWQACDGSTLSIADNTVLFDLIGTTYGGDGLNTYNVPDLRGRIPIHQGSNGSDNYVIGQIGGQETRTLSVSNLPQHTHTLGFAVPLPAASAIATSNIPGGHALANTGRNLSYSTSAPDVSLGGGVALSGTATASTGSSLPFSIRQPYLTVNCAISLFGVFPSQN